MATASPSPPRVESSPEPDGSGPVVLYHVPWGLYEQMVEELEHSNARLTYDEGALEIMSPSPEYEQESRLFHDVIAILTEELDIPMTSFGSTTYKHRDLKKGLEPDECYYTVNLDRVVGKKRLDLAVDPPPDLAVEVEVTRRLVGRQSIYEALGVPELWRFDGRTLRFLLRSPGGSYVTAERSPTLPMVTAEEIVGWVLRGLEGNQTRWRREFRAWVRERFVEGQ